MLKTPGLPFDLKVEIYDRLVPETNELRRIKDLLDFSFIYDELSDKYCLNNGRMSEDPVKLFKYLFLKCRFELSDVDIVQQSQYDLSFRYFLGMDLEEGLINPSTLTKFRKLRLENGKLLDVLLAKTIELGEKHGVINSKTIIVDSTHTKSRYKVLKPLDELRYRSKKLRKSIYAVSETYRGQLPEKNKQSDIAEEIGYCKRLIKQVKQDDTFLISSVVDRNVNYLEEAIDDFCSTGVLSADRDARVGHKDEDTSFFGFKTHTAVTPEGIISAAIVTSGEKTDGDELISLVDKSIENGIEVEEIIGDGAYSTSSIITETQRRDIKLVSKINKTSMSCEGLSINGFSFNKDSGMLVCKAGIQARERGIIKHSKDKEVNYYFCESHCLVCKYKNECYVTGKPRKNKVVLLSRDKIRDKFPEQVRFQNSEEFKRRYKNRYIVESKNADLKNNYGYGKAHSKGIPSMELQSAVTLFTANVRRILRLVDQK